MNTTKLTDRMEEAVHSYREQLSKNEESRLMNISIAAKLGVEAVKSFFYGSEQTQNSLDNFKASSEAFERAMREQDQRSATLALDRMEREIRNIRGGNA